MNKNSYCGYNWLASPRRRGASNLFFWLVVFFDWCSNIFWAKSQLRKPASSTLAQLATSQKNTITEKYSLLFSFCARRFFLLKGKENFYAGFCS